MSSQFDVCWQPWPFWKHWRWSSWFFSCRKSSKRLKKRFITSMLWISLSSTSSDSTMSRSSVLDSVTFSCSCSFNLSRELCFRARSVDNWSNRLISASVIVRASLLITISASLLNLVGTLRCDPRDCLCISLLEMLTQFFDLANLVVELLSLFSFFFFVLFFVFDPLSFSLSLIFMLLFVFVLFRVLCSKL